MAFCVNGHEIKESTEETDENKARKKLAARIAAIQKDEPVIGPSRKKLTLEDLEKELEADYRLHGRRSFETVKHCLKPLKEFFQHDRLFQITRPKLQEYQAARLNAGMARATINREVRYLLRGLKLLVEGKRLAAVPRVKLLENENIREGFLNRPEFEAMAEHLKPDVQDVVRFLYNSAWRSGEALKLEWAKVDMSDPQNWIVRLTRKNEKTKHPRTLPLVGELREVIERRLELRRPDCPCVFHRDGVPIKSFRAAFKAACKDAGLAGLLPHDMRRSAIRNFRKAGVSESDGMKLSGHRTNSVYKRYDIVDEADQRRAMERVQEHQQREKESRKVVPIKRVG
jgi:integrase